jgi:broad specificity phosphatase PhoE
MPPTTIMLIRHGEKPVVPPPYGVNADGDQDKHSLSVRGWQRAGALVPFFRWPRVEGIVTPAAIYASAVSEQAVLVEGDDVAKSLRPQQTVTPLAAALSLDVVTQWTVGQEPQLAAALRGVQGAVLVAWEHKHIPVIAAQFTTAAPTAWPDDAYDVVWLLQENAGTYTFAERQQNLLAGDAA